MSTELSDLLRAGMERVPAQVSPGLAERAYRRYRRHRARTRAAAVGGTVAVTSAVALAATGNLGGRSAPGATSARTAAYVIDRTARALDASESTKMMAATERSGAGRMQTWSANGTSRTEVFSLSGQPVYDNSLLFTPASHTVVNVDYQTRTWYRYTRQNPPSAQLNPTYIYQVGTHIYRVSDSPSCGNPPGELMPSPKDMAAQLREWVSCGVLKIGQTSEVDGVQAISLTGSFDRLTMTYWVDTASYLPVRMTGEHSQWDIRWLPATPANLADLTVPIPPRFTQVKPPALAG